MEIMFKGDNSLKALDGSKFRTENIKIFKAILLGYAELKTIDVSKFYTSNADDIYRIFQYCSFPRYADIINFETSSS